MRIFIDGDACPVKKECESIAISFNLPLIIVSDKAHNIVSDYADIIKVDTSSDSADFLIFSKLNSGDILISQDLGLCSMAISKGVYCLNPNGESINNFNIDFLLQNRHISSKLRREKKIYTKIKKRESHMNNLFKEKLKELIESKI